jgi:hypothetical protein
MWRRKLGKISLMDYNFLLQNSWFDKNWNIPGNGRYLTFKIALNLFMQNGGRTIVETGTNWFNDLGGGRSTNIFGEYLKQYGGKLYTVDIQQKSIDACKEFTKGLEGNIEYVTDDSLHFLENWHQPIDLLYLDSFDYPIEMVVPDPLTEKTPDQIIAEVLACQEHQLAEIKLAYPNLHVGSIILLDDNQLPKGGKTRLSKQFLVEKGIKCIFDDAQQSLWMI